MSRQVSTSNFKALRRMTQRLSVIVLLFVVSWIPLSIVNIILFLCPHCSLPIELVLFTVVLSHLNSAWNPALYAWGMQDFKMALRRLFRFDRPLHSGSSSEHLSNMAPSNDVTCHSGGEMIQGRA